MSPPWTMKVTPDRLRETLDLSRDLVAVSSHQQLDERTMEQDEDEDEDEDEDVDEDEDDKGTIYDRGEGDAIKPLVTSAQLPRRYMPYHRTPTVRARSGSDPRTFQAYRSRGSTRKSTPQDDESNATRAPNEESIEETSMCSNLSPLACDPEETRLEKWNVKEAESLHHAKEKIRKLEAAGAKIKTRIRRVCKADSESKANAAPPLVASSYDNQAFTDYASHYVQIEQSAKQKRQQLIEHRLEQLRREAAEADRLLAAAEEEELRRKQQVLAAAAAEQEEKQRRQREQEEKQKQAEAEAEAEAKAKKEKEEKEARYHAAASTTPASLQSIHSSSTERKSESGQNQAADDGAGGAQAAHPRSGMGQPQFSQWKGSDAAMMEQDKIKQQVGGLIEIATAIRKDSLRKAQRVVIDRQLTKFINQISATMQQISKKTQEIVRYLESYAGPGGGGGGGGGEWKAYAMVVLASKMVGQCEGQISRDLSAAFPLAAVIAALSDRIPEFAALVYNRLANKCPLVVPKFPRQETEMRELLGFTRQPRASSDKNKDDDPEWEWESLTSYEEKLRGYLALFGALCQNNDTNKNSSSAGIVQVYFSLDRLWIWSARLLNELPFNSYVATALAATWRTAGYKLHRRFGRQFTKFMALVTQVPLPLLEASVQAHPEEYGARARESIAFLKSALRLGLEVPRGAVIAMSDTSSSVLDAGDDDADREY